MNESPTRINQIGPVKKQDHQQWCPTFLPRPNRGKPKRIITNRDGNKNPPRRRWFGDNPLGTRPIWVCRQCRKPTDSITPPRLGIYILTSEFELVGGKGWRGWWLEEAFLERRKRKKLVQMTLTKRKKQMFTNSLKKSVKSH